MKKLVLIASIVLFSLAGSNRACEPPDCDRIDCGTCGNSCCTLEFFTKLTTYELNVALAASLKMGGPDQHYTFVGYTDLRPYNISAHFILQGVHTTLVKKYNDTLNFAIYPLSILTQNEFKSKVRAFSVSQIYGALCDDGQNYKNLILLFKGLSKLYV